MGQTLAEVKQGRREDSWYNRRIAPEIRAELVSLDEYKLLQRLRSLDEGDYVVFVSRKETGIGSPMDLTSEPAPIKFKVKEVVHA